jgi:hypothetical protein
MKRVAWAIGCCCLLAGSACKDTPEVKTPVTDAQVVQPDSSHTLSLAEFEARIQARTARRDTAVIDHGRLQALLVDSIPGYALEVDEANTFHAPLFTFAEASKVFYNGDEDYVELTAGDYVDNPDFFRVNLQRYNLAMGVNISGVQDEKRMDDGLRPAQAQQFFAWASYNSRKHVAWVFIGVDDRYFVTIEATAQAGFIAMEQVQAWLDWGQVLGK